MTKYRAAIFDRNNVLIEYDFDYAQQFFGPLLPVSIFELGDLWQEWGEKVGFPATPADEEQFWQGFWSNLSKELALSPEITQQLQAFNYLDVLRPYPDARPALQTARKQGLKIGVLSNFPLATIEASLAAVNLLDLVDAAYSATNIGVAKPDAKAYQHMLQALQVSPTETLFFDDTPKHIEGAQQLGLQAYLLNRQYDHHILQDQIICDLAVMSKLLEI